MAKRSVSGAMLTLLFIGLLMPSFNPATGMDGARHKPEALSTSLPGLNSPSISSSSAPPVAQWNRTYGGTNDDTGSSIVQTGDGGYAIVGTTNSFGAGLSDVWLVKTDGNGTVVWNKTYGGAAGDDAQSLVESSASDGGYAIGGTTNSFGDWLGDFWLIKTDANGTEEWNQTYRGIGQDEVHSIVQTRDGGYALAGHTGPYFGPYDAWLVKTNSTGHIQWTQTYDRVGEDDDALSIVQTRDGGYALAGHTGSYHTGYWDFWLVKTNSTGHVQWTQTYGGAGADRPASVVQTIDGGYAIAGYTTSFGAGLTDMWLVKTDASGNMQWNQTYGGANDDRAQTVVQTSDGGYALGGYTSSFGAGAIDFWLVRTDESGRIQWNQTYGGASNDLASSVLQTDDGGYALAGWTESFGAGGRDIWMIKLKVHDIAVTNVTSSKTVVGRGYSARINVTVENQGTLTETFNVTAYAHNLTVFSEGFENGTFDGWDFYYSTNGAQNGSIAPGTWSSSMVSGASALSESYSARLFADSTSSQAPWRVNAAVNRTTNRNRATRLKATLKFDQITDSGSVGTRGHAYFLTTVYNALNLSEYVSYGFDNSTSKAFGDVSYNVSPGDLVNFEADLAADWFNKYGKDLPKEVMIRFKASADYNEDAIGNQTMEVRLDNIALVAPTPIFYEGFDGGTFAGWDFYYSTNGAQNGSILPGDWSSSIVSGDTALSGLYSASLLADSHTHGGGGGPWRVDAAINRTLIRHGARLLKATLNFDDITEGGDRGHAVFYLVVWNALNMSEAISYGFDNSTSRTFGDLSYNVSPGDLVNFEADLVADWLTKYGRDLPEEIMIRFHATADYNEWGPVERQTIRVRLDDVALTPAPIGTATVALQRGDSTTITFLWNSTGFAKGSYIISAYAWPVWGETDTTDNAFSDGWITIAMVGDVTGPNGGPDGKVDIRDIAAIALLFGVNYPDPLYNPNYDLTGPTRGLADGKIDMRDIALAARHFGQIDP